MRLIDADKLRNIIYYGKCDTAYFDIATDREIVKLIDEQPTVNDMLCGECEKRIRKDAKEKVLDDAEKLLDKIAPDKVAEIKCGDGEIRNRPLIDIARVYEILEQIKGGAE